MNFLKLYWFLFLIAPTISVPFQRRWYSPEAISDGSALQQLGIQAFTSTLLRLGTPNSTSKCNPSTVTVRQEWRTLSAAQRKSYVAAVNCLKSKPSVFTSDEAPGAINLYDSFVAIHINLTQFIHETAYFLTWHRYFTWTYEQMLQNECGYEGGIPYWEWGLDAEDITASPIFDGSDSSMGSNGVNIYSNTSGVIVWNGAPQSPPSKQVYLGIGTGGGCVFEGPFKDWAVNMGPVGEPNYINYPNVTELTNILGLNPRCLKRDLRPWVAKTFLTFTNITSLILDYNTIELFQAVMQGDPRYITTAQLGVHGGGHYAFGAGAGLDVFTSPGDPVFFLHHAQVDRVYALWQALDFANRQDVFGRGYIQDVIITPNVTVDDYIDLSKLNDKLQIKDTMDTVGGTPFCYVYQ
ncbi:MAG: hypothetical protein M1834_005222 [Cirrosporium novae-zelandiae]|nr:MAG: hypothetical protein M1834_005222 [Cirrosporium novae-zelandiae]